MQVKQAFTFQIYSERLVNYFWKKSRLTDPAAQIYASWRNTESSPSNRHGCVLLCEDRNLHFDTTRWGSSINRGADRQLLVIFLQRTMNSRTKFPAGQDNTLLDLSLWREAVEPNWYFRRILHLKSHWHLWPSWGWCSIIHLPIYLFILQHLQEHLPYPISPTCLQAKWHNSIEGKF